MANYVVLDTSIYRELGFKFFNNIDYKNLCSFTINTDGEVLLSEIVAEEFCNYYNDNLKSKINELLKSTKDLKRDPFFNYSDINNNNIEVEFQKAITKFRDALIIDPINSIRIAFINPTMIDGLELTQFILESRETKESNIQIRDYLIWDSILNYAKTISEDRTTYFGRRKVTFKKSIVTFITKDKGFEQNLLFQKLKKEYGVKNVEVEKSIAAFLNKKGFHFKFITPELIKQKISKSRILENLKKDIGALLSYVSERYIDNCYEKEVIEAEVEKIEIEEYYTYLDSEDNKHKFIAHLKVYLRVVFERDEDGYKQSIEQSKIENQYMRSLETYDEQQRPYFQKPILFFYGGLVNILCR